MLSKLGERVLELRGTQLFIANSASVIGSVILENNVSEWFGALLRADNEPIHIGENTNIPDGAMPHTDPGASVNISANVSVGHQATIHGCTIGERQPDRRKCAHQRGQGNPR